MCRQWSGRQVFAAANRYSPYYQYSDTPSGSYFCVSQVDPGGREGSAITFGVPFGIPAGSAAGSRDQDRSSARTASAASAPRRAGRALGGKGVAVGPRPHPHPVGAAAGSFPGVDDVDIYEFLDRHAAE